MAPFIALKTLIPMVVLLKYVILEMSYIVFIDSHIIWLANNSKELNFVIIIRVFYSLKYTILNILN